MTASGRDAWQNEPLGALGQLVRGRGGTKADERESGLPCIRYGELYTRHDFVVREFFSFISPSAAGSYTRLREGDVIFAASGETLDEIGKAAAYCDNSVAYAGSDTIIFRPGARVDGRFLGYVVNHEPANRYKSRMGQGSTVMHIGSAALSRMPIDLPPLPEQQRIAEILDTLDEAIRKTEQVIAKLQQVKQGLLHDLLTRGIDEHGELRDPERHPEQFKDSELGRVPRDWEVRVLAEVAEVRSGIAKNTGRVLANSVTVDYLRVANVQDGFLDLSEMNQISVPRAQLDRYRVLPGDLLMNEGGDLDKLGRGALWRGEIHTCVHQNHVFVVRPGPLVDARYLDVWTGSSSARRYFLVTGKQTTNLASINKTALGCLPVLLPPLGEQRRIVSNLESHDDEARWLTQELSKLRSLKSGLMHDLLTGRVRTSR